MMNQANVWLVDGEVMDFVVTVEENTEIRPYQYETLGIDAVRSLVDAANQRPSGAQTQVLLIRAQGVTLEAQNALLKVLEDTPTTTAITLVLPKETKLLDTVRSRVQLREESVTNETEAFNIFMDDSIAGRIAQIEKRLKAKDNDWIRGIKRGLVHYLKTTNVPSLEACEYVASRLLTRGASNKMLLEHLALSLEAR